MGNRTVKSSQSDSGTSGTKPQDEELTVRANRGIGDMKPVEDVPLVAFCALYLLACQVGVVVGSSGLCLLG